MKKSMLLFIAVIMAATYCYAQSSRMFIPLDVKKAYDNGTRSLDGKPGPNYWQNSSDYKINVELDPQKMILSGSETIIYKNNSPKRLSMLVIRLYQDIFKKGMARNYQMSADDISDGVTIKKITVNGEQVETDPKKPFAARSNGTNYIVTLKNSIEAKSEAKIEVEWSFPIAKKTQMRMGLYEPETFFMAYFYPQVAVYDDVDGWDRIQYKGTVEFYNDFNNYDVNVTVPAGYAVWATGILQNGKDNFTGEILKRIETAKSSDKVINIITKEDIEKKNVLSKEAKTEWHFIAENVTDFAFSTGKEMIWDASTLKLPNGNETFISSINNKGVKNAELIAGYARKAIEHFSTKTPGVSFPYPSMTVFNHAGSGGMEFPMMVNDGVGSNVVYNVGVTVHEISHTYMPFYMGINERKHAFMDEGWAVMFTYDGQEAQLPDSKPRDGDAGQLSYIMGQEDELPPIINSSILAGGEGMTYNVASYPRPGMAYYFLRDALGEDLFNKTLREYINRWHGKHPIPYDFFYTFNQIAGEDLSWYWIPWFFERGYADLSIKNVTVQDGIYKTTVEKVGTLPVPVVVKFFYEDNTSDVITKSTSVWKSGNNEFLVEFKPAKKVIRVEVGEKSIPDVDKKNNKYEFEAAKNVQKVNLKEYEGSYEYRQMTLNLSIEDNKLIADVNGQQKIEFSNVKGDEFEVSGAPVTIKFVRDENKKVSGIEIDENGNVTKAKKLN
jgi:hypothetical protein